MQGTSVGVGMGTGTGPGHYGSWPQDMGTADGGTDQREVITPPGGRPAGRSKPSQSSSKRHADRGSHL